MSRLQRSAYGRALVRHLQLPDVGVVRRIVVVHAELLARHRHVLRRLLLQLLPRKVAELLLVRLEELLKDLVVADVAGVLHVEAREVVRIAAGHARAWDQGLYVQAFRLGVGLVCTGIC